MNKYSYDPAYVEKYGAGPHLAVDAVVISADAKLLLIKRKSNNQWALPGGFVDAGEEPLHTAFRELHEETGLTATDLNYIGRELVTDPHRDPRAHIITLPHLFVSMHASYTLKSKAGDDAIETAWIDLKEIPSADLYADHRVIAMSMLVTHEKVIANVLLSMSKSISQPVAPALPADQAETATPSASSRDWKVSAIKWLSGIAVIGYLARTVGII